MSRIPGIDISVWDEGIDLNAWKTKHSIGFAIVKCGGNEGGRYADRCFADHMRKAQAAGLAVGVYFYTTSTTINAALGDADYCVDLIHGYDLKLPVFMDVEDKAQFALSPRALTDVIKAFCDRVQEHGYRAGLYTGGYAWNNNMHPDELRGYCTWIASWQQEWPAYVGKIDMWQQGTKRLSDGHIFYDDVSGCQDFDWCEDYVIKGGGGKVPKNLFNPAEEMAELHAWMCTDPAFGYNIDSPGGNRPTGMRKYTTKSGRTYEIMGGDYSCSTSIITVTKTVFARTKYAHAFDGASYTGDMRKAYVSSGLWAAVWQAAVRGDIYLNEGVHTALCQDGGNDGVFGVDMLSEFNRSEDPNDRYHGKSGDQDGYESVIRTYYDDHWNIILHYVGGLIEDLMWDGEKGEPEKDDSKEGGGMIVPKFVIFDDDPTEHITEDGIHAHPIANADEKKAIILWWDKVNGIKLDPNPIHFGSKDAPWGARYNDVMSRGANFKTFEKFNKHPSTRAVMRDENARQTAEILKGIEAALS